MEHHKFSYEPRTEGLMMTTYRGFQPECTLQHVRLIEKTTAVVQVAVSYDEGVALEGGDHIPPFSEIQRLALIKWMAHVGFLRWERRHRISKSEENVARP